MVNIDFSQEENIWLTTFLKVGSGGINNASKPFFMPFHFYIIHCIKVRQFDDVPKLTPHTTCIKRCNKFSIVLMMYWRLLINTQKRIQHLGQSPKLKCSPLKKLSNFQKFPIIPRRVTKRLINDRSKNGEKEGKCYPLFMRLVELGYNIEQILTG